MSKQEWELLQEKYYEEADEHFISEKDIEEYVELRFNGLSEAEAMKKIYDSIYHQV